MGDSKSEARAIYGIALVYSALLALLALAHLRVRMRTRPKALSPSATERGGIMGNAIVLECGCGHEYTPDPLKTLIYVYDDELDYTHLRTICPNCKQKFFFFFDDPRFLTLGYTELHIPWAPSDVKNVYDQVMGMMGSTDDTQETKPQPTQDELLDEALVSIWHDELERMKPDDFAP